MSSEFGVPSSEYPCWATAGALVALALCLSGPSQAHEGHDHGEAPRPANVELAPRMEVASDDFELLAEAKQGGLVVYLDRYATNEPVAGATVEVEAGNRRAVLAERAPGEYAGNFALSKGRQELTFTVRAAGTDDLLIGALDIPAAKAAAATSASASLDRRLRAAALAGVVGALLIVGWRMWRKKKK